MARMHTVVIEASADGKIWQAVEPSETVQADGDAGDVAEDVASNQNVATEGQWRVRVWKGVDADQGTEPAAEVYSD